MRENNSRGCFNITYRLSILHASMTSGHVSISSGLKVSELKDKLAELGLSTQGNKDILRERLHSFLDAGSSNEQDIHVENPPNETKMVTDDTDCGR